MKFLIGCLSLVSLLFAVPPEQIPPHLYEEFTLNRRVGIGYAYFDNAYSSEHPLFYETQRINSLIEKALRRENNYYDDTDAALYTMLDKYRSAIEGKKIGIIGSAEPWYESVVLAYGGHPITVEYNKIETDDPRLTLMTVEEYEKSPVQFDAILSISSIEHDGLGRYGDPIDPWGDIKAMQKMKQMLKPDGLLFLAVPYGSDYLLWNAHRVYGSLRMPLLLSGWNQVDFAPAGFQPVFVLKAQ
jgi:SAM-dependent methyltransferase